MEQKPSFSLNLEVKVGAFVCLLGEKAYKREGNPFTNALTTAEII